LPCEVACEASSSAAHFASGCTAGWQKPCSTLMVLDCLNCESVDSSEQVPTRYVLSVTKLRSFPGLHRLANVVAQNTQGSKRSACSTVIVGAADTLVWILILEYTLLPDTSGYALLESASIPWFWHVTSLMKVIPPLRRRILSKDPAFKVSLACGLLPSLHRFEVMHGSQNPCTRSCLAL
jgi:hypothetical protein